ncbi:ComEC/Rec2 family competence protein [Bifidobacterium mongoliense]|uniref:Competence protein n=1 Tax=Bifidobacterium mongoliense TaxID=518643 RepID=A0A423UBR5_9BIFI|nr:ComEC/Rec2 family competence protein [Bifidobacterium mongoliense]ROT86146.1 competence protein [Bifidobacterium mongoliense]
MTGPPVESPATSAGRQPVWSAEGSGWRDRRMVPVAIVVWVSCLSTHALFEAVMDHYARPGPSHDAEVRPPWVPIAPVVTSATGVLGVLGVLGALGVVSFMGVSSARRRLRGAANADGVRHPSRSVRHPRPRSWRPLWCGTVMTALGVLGTAALIGGLATLGADVVRWHDPAAAAARQGAVTVVVTVRVRSPAVASMRRTSDCQAEVVVRAMDVRGVVRSSGATALLFATGSDCGVLRRGSGIEARGTLERARFGRQPLWFTVIGGGISLREGPTWLDSANNRMHDAFFAVTGRLSDQGRVLVPGLTMGLLGQDHVGDGTGGDASRGEAPLVDATYARLLEERFRRSGIMHLMAVSGGHFSVLGVLVRRTGSTLHLPRNVVAPLQIIAYLLLAGAMYPSDSLLRAVVMGALVSWAWLMGRPAQAVSALSWTVVAVLILDPGMSRSLGFALSCSAVLGIALYARPMARMLGARMPGALAEVLSMTVCAQAFTLPIQLLMEPEIPLLSVPANLLVAPFVDIATLAGLLGMVLAPCAPALAYPPIWVSSVMTAVMERCAVWLSDGSMATMPWVEGVRGALAMAVIEIAVVIVLVLWRRRLRRRDAAGHGRWAPHGWQALRRWLGETRSMLDGT